MAIKTDIILLITFIMFLNTKKIVSKKRSHKKHTTNTGAPSQKVLLVSLDGWRWDFVSKNKQLLPNMAKLEKQGVMANFVENVFPTNTFPNHYSAVTGLYPENHGIIDNQMYDTKTGVKFSMESTDPKWWNEAEPIWVTNQIQGHKSGVCYWPGHNVKIRGVLPTYRATHRNYGNPVVDFDKPLMPHKERIDLTLQWLQQPGVTFAAMYFEDIDSMCHKLGNIEKNVGQTDVKNAMQKLDDAFSYLSTRMDGLGLGKKVNVIVIGDHGRTEVSPSKIIRLNNYIHMRTYVTMATGKTFIAIYPKPGKLKFVYNKLKKAHPNMKVYLKKDFPEHFHIKHNKRTAPLLIVPDSGWLIDTAFDNDHFKGDKLPKGEHGYSNLVKDMNPGFFAFGPCFKKGLTVNKIRTIDLYSLMCKIIGITPKKNDGSFDKIKDLLDNYKCFGGTSNAKQLILGDSN